MLCVVPSLLLLCYGFRASQWHWAQAAVQGQCGLRPELGVFNVPQSTGSLRIIGEITEHPQSKAVPKHIYNWKWSEVHTGCVLSSEQCRIYHSFERLDLQSSKFPLCFRESTLLLQQKSVIVGEWNSSFLKFSPFLGSLFSLGNTLNLFYLLQNSLQGKLWLTAFFFHKRLRRKWL